MYNLSVWLFSLDADGDGFYDEEEYSCGSDPFDNTSVPSDTDADGICDGLDEDIDGDGVNNANDTFPEDSSETSDNDGDGIGDNADTDDDGDGWEDYWAALRDNGVLVTSGWEDAYWGEVVSGGADRPSVFSYASSPPAEGVHSDPPIPTPPPRVAPDP